MKANLLKRLIRPFLPGPGLSFLSHSVIQQIFIESLFYAQERGYGSVRSRQKSSLSGKLHIHPTEGEEIISERVEYK